MHYFSNEVLIEDYYIRRLFRAAIRFNDLVDRTANENITGNWSFLGFTGFGTKTPARNVHINDTLRIEPRSTAPTSAALGDLYVDKDTNTICFYNATNFITVAGTGPCV